MTSPTLDADPACPETATAAVSDADLGVHGSATGPRHETGLVVQETTVGAIAQDRWDELAGRSPAATPFSKWAFHRAWWDGYGASAHDQTLVVRGHDAHPDELPVAIVPLMHRHEVEPTDALTRSTIRHIQEQHLTPVAPTAKAIFFGASYHADYATVLAAPDDLPAVARATVDHLVAQAHRTPGHPAPWDVIDLRRLRCADPAGDALLAAFDAVADRHGWRVVHEQEDVCPVATLPAGVDFQGFLDRLRKKTRHEIRRKIRRAEAIGPVALTESNDLSTDLDAFIDLHQRRWGAAGLFPPTAGGNASRTFLRRLFEEVGPHGVVRLSFLSVADRRIGAGIHFDDGTTISYYNAGIDPEARELSVGVLMVAWYVQLALRLGRSRLDLLRGDEPYKYDWGAVDEPIRRLLVCREGM